MEEFQLTRLHRAAQRGFTLLELLVVLLIVALLAGYVGPKLFSQVDRAKGKTALRQMTSLADALGQYRLDVGHYPSEEQGLAALLEAPGDEPAWAGPYLANALPKDPWGHDYIWHNPARRPDAAYEVEIVSPGSGESGKSGAEILHGF
jgi:general secretion pathway protein G